MVAWSQSLSEDAPNRSIRRVVEEMLGCLHTSQWADVVASSGTNALSGDSSTGLPEGEGSNDGQAPEQLSMVFQRVCARTMFASNPSVPHGVGIADARGRHGVHWLDEHTRAAQVLVGQRVKRQDLDLRSQLDRISVHIARLVVSAGRAALAVKSGERAHRHPGAHGRRGREVRSLDELMRRMDDKSGLDALIGVARLGPEEHSRSLEAAWRWCDKRGIESADDLLGGGLDLKADAALWEELLAALPLSGSVVLNRIRRELMARRAALVDANLRHRSARSSGTSSSGAGLPTTGKGSTSRQRHVCSVQ